MEQRPQGEMKGAGIVDSVKKWSHDHLTLQGREDAIYLKKYAHIAESLPKDMPDNQMALLEIRLRQKAHSAAIGSIVVDALMTGGALVGTGVLLKKVDFSFPKFERRMPQTARRRPVVDRTPVRPPVPAAYNEPRWSLVAFAKKVSRVFEGHGEDIDMKKVADGADRALDAMAKVKWDAPADWTEKGIEKAGTGLKKLWGWLDGALGKVADNM